MGSVAGARSTMLVVREAPYGTTRFDDFVRRTHSTDAVAASRLKRLTELGVLAREPYKEPGHRTRYEYRLTDRGRDLAPVVFALMQWGTGTRSPAGADLWTSSSEEQEPRVAVAACSEGGSRLELDDLAIVANFPLGEHADEASGAQ
ncbi:MAG: hypothetical protein ABS81_05255 [Pseudonocardia sp. SCN 72-86]|nr:MAG: hypothetical protein ABS81_05255 [Pseudonocardia sp. SCN 72-86]